MKIAVFSDSHSDVNRMTQILKKNPVDLVLHLGDYIRDAHKLHSLFPEIPVFAVKGNNDILRDEPLTRIERIAGVTFFMAHGHQYSFGYRTAELYQDAVSADADVALFGHTHYPHIEQCGSVLILNPGSTSMPRGGSKASWARITIGASKSIQYEILDA